MLTSNLVYTLAVYATGCLCNVGILPWFVLPCVVVSGFSRWAFSIHSRTHFQGRYPLMEELMPLVMGPFSVGLNEQRSVHRRHHAALGGQDDPDWLFYNAQPLISLLLCCLHPEITFYRELKCMSLRGLSGACFRLILFTILFLVAGTDFVLWYLLPIRALFGGSQFVFTWMLHHREEERTIGLALPPCLTLLVGKVGMQELATHAIHHKRQYT